MIDDKRDEEHSYAVASKSALDFDFDELDEIKRGKEAQSDVVSNASSSGEIAGGKRKHSEIHDAGSNEKKEKRRNLETNLTTSGDFQTKETDNLQTKDNDNLQTKHNDNLQTKENLHDKETPYKTTEDSTQDLTVIMGLLLPVNTPAAEM